MSVTLHSPRIRRAETPPRYYSNHRKYYPYLLKDFKGRCAYSLQHYSRSNGENGMEVDHFNPTLRGGLRNRYSNLNLATRHCNGAKSDKWPTAEDQSAGIRFIDPCAEADYGVHIFEDPVTFELWGATSAGKYHIRQLKLNAPHLVDERRMRTKIRALWARTGIYKFEGKLGSDEAAALALMQIARQQADLMVSDIPQRTKPGQKGSA